MLNETKEWMCALVRLQNRMKKAKTVQSMAEALYLFWKIPMFP